MIASIAVVIAGLGLLMLFILGRMIAQHSNEGKLDRYRSKDMGFADLLIHAAVVEDGVIVGKNGSLMAAWRFTGADTASSTDIERENISSRLNQALSRLGNGWMIHVDSVRQPVKRYSDRGASKFPDAISCAIDEERRHYFENLSELYESIFVITLTYLPPRIAQQKFVEIMFDDENESSGLAEQSKALLDYYMRECANFESHVSSTFQMIRLKAKTQENEDGSVILYDEFLSWLKYCISSEQYPVALPKNPMYLDGLLGAQELWSGVVPKVGRYFVQTVSIDGFPLESTPGMLNLLAELQGTYRWSSRFIFLDSHVAVSHLDKYRKKWKQKVRGFYDQVFNLNSSYVDEDALNMVDDAQSAIAETNSGTVGQGYYSSVIVLMREDRNQLEIASRLVEKAINQLGFNARLETVNTLEAYLGSIPGHGVENVRRPMITR